MRFHKLASVFQQAVDRHLLCGPPVRFEIAEQVPHGLESCFTFFLQHLGDDSFDFFGTIDRESSQRGWIFVQDVVHQLRFTFAGEWSLKGEQLVERDSDGPDIGARIRAFSFVQLGRHVRPRSDHQIGLCPGNIKEASDSEVHHFHRTVFRHHDVGWLDVSVDDAVAMRMIKCFTSAHDVSELQEERKHGATFDDAVEAFSLEVFHCDERDTLSLTEFINSDDIGVLERTCGACFLIESFE